MHWLTRKNIYDNGRSLSMVQLTAVRPNLSFIKTEQYSRHFSRRDFQIFFVNENYYIRFQFHCKGPIDNKSALIWVMA